MKNYKRLLALGLSVAMIAGLTACGGSDSGSTPASSSTADNSTTTTESGGGLAKAFSIMKARRERSN